MDGSQVMDQGTDSSRFATEEARWTAVCARDRAADGHFLFAVVTTGVVCRPSCAARQPKRQNVRFYDRLDQALEDGFRPCKRCKPDQPDLVTSHAQAIARLCRRIEASETAIPLKTLAEEAGLSLWHFQRVFTAIVGVSPAAYHRACRTERLREDLQQADSVTGAILDAGYGSLSRHYGEGGSRLGMAAGQYRAQGAGQAIRFAIAETRLGSALIAATDKGLCSIRLGDDPQALLEEFQSDFAAAQLIGDDPAFDRLVADAVGLIEGRSDTATAPLPIDIRGTAFQEQVWQVLRQIPRGETWTYADVAAAMGRPRSVRAVANACGANPVAIAVPCHRVVRSDGGLGGYRWGVARKQALLDRESGGDTA